MFVIDIRNEYTHIPAFRKYADFMKAVCNRSLTGKQFRFSFDTQKEYALLFQTMCNFRNCTIVVDEADALFQVRDFEKGLINVFLGSRNLNVTLYFVGKRPFLIPVIVRSQADEYVIFAIGEERDITYLEGRVRKEFPKSPYDLKQGEAIIFKEGEPPKLIKAPKFNPNASNTVVERMAVNE